MRVGEDDPKPLPRAPPARVEDVLEALGADAPQLA